MPYFGAHMSAAGGVHMAVERISAVGGEALQVFSKNQRQWKAPPLAPGDVERYRAAREAWGYPHVAAHAAYLINLGSPPGEVLEKSVAAFADELVRAGMLGIPYVVLHPGAHKGAGVEAGLKAVAANLDRCLKVAEMEGVAVLLETTSGMGSSLGRTFEELGEIIRLSRYPERLGVCLDTCHVFAAGYDLREEGSYEAAMAGFDAAVGLERLKWFHVNDTKTAFGSHHDRHEHIGKGQLGLEPFRLLVNDPRFAEHPMTLETPKGEDLAEDRMNLAVLRGLAGK